jgi:hypothetical protein
MMTASLNHHHHHWQNSSFAAIAFLRRFCLIASGFHFGFWNDNFLQSKVASLASNPKPQGSGPFFMFPSDREAQLHPREVCSLFITFYDSQGYGGSILTCLQTPSLNN